MTATGTHPAARRRDSAATKQALVDAARDLFAAHGYDRTTLRDVGDRAGVDAALVARYFGSKAALYSAAIDADNEASGTPAIADLADAAARVLRRVDERGVGPLIQALLHPQSDAETRTIASGHMHRRVVDPVIAEMRANGIGEADAALRAETAVAALIGIAAVRGLGGFPSLHDVDRDELTTLLTTALAPLAQP